MNIRSEKLILILLTLSLLHISVKIRQLFKYNGPPKKPFNFIQRTMFNRIGL